MTALSRLCSAPAERFAAEIWGRREWLSTGLAYDDLFSLSAADELLSRRALRTPFLRMAADGRVLATGRFTGSGGAGATVADQVRDDAVLSLFADGATVVLQGLHRLWDPIRAVAADLTDELGHPVQVNAYITPAQSQGFDPHYDTHDVFVLQVAGRKHWRVHAPVVVDPMPDQPWGQVADEVAARAAEEPLLDRTLEPGDCLYLPRGFIHSATALAETSLHLTFGIHTVTQRDVVAAAFDEIRHSGWGESLPAGWDPDSDLAAIRRLMDDAAQRLRSLDPTLVAERLYRQRAAAQLPEPVTPLATAEAAARLTGDQMVRLRGHLVVRVDGDTLRVGDTRKVELTSGQIAAVEQLLPGKPLRVADLTCGDPIALAARLMREGVVVLAVDD
ncbi:MAG: cupin-like domain-containing protein [Actinobacteria bacterium]|nr:cupin-like domain-containing protein [Actinomycetota bacterium]TXH40106.1 MAG: cupin [Actinomycetota bacterium]